MMKLCLDGSGLASLIQFTDNVPAIPDDLAIYTLGKNTRSAILHDLQGNKVFCQAVINSKTNLNLRS